MNLLDMGDFNRHMRGYNFLLGAGRILQKISNMSSCWSEKYGLRMGV